MILSLEQLLEQCCGSPKLEFTEQLERVKQSAYQIWKVPNLSWYTDHGFDHSQRVIDVLGQIVAHLQETDQNLNPAELFIILAASYLHDIGMQDLKIDGKEVETLGPEDYEFIRRRHPHRAYELIIQSRITLKSTGAEEDRQFGIDLGHLPRLWVKAIALVAQGHGSEFFRETLDQFAGGRHQIQRWDLRGKLLAALLMMADELDLLGERAQLRPGMTLSPISAMHHHIHLYITSVQVVRGETDKERRIRIWFEFPEDSNVYVKTRKWLIGKLYRQCQITAPVIKSETNGELEWCERIALHEVVAQQEEGGPPALPRPAELELSKELADREAVGYTPERDVLKSKVLKSKEYCTLYLISRDAHATKHVIDWLSAHCACHDIGWIQIRIHAANPKDIPIRLHKHLNELVLAPAASTRRKKRDAQFVDSEPLAQLRDMIAKDLHQFAKRQRIVLVFTDVDSAVAPKVAPWLEQDFTSKLAERGAPLQVIMTYTDAPELEGTPDAHRVPLTLAHFSEDDIAEHFRQEFGLAEAKAREEAKDLYRITDGEPRRVIVKFEIERRKRVKSLGAQEA